ncbi:MAG TPA: hypothetical protein VHB79_14700 [Polyangiaceae bacterium]|nr:hypothetical protein [Polyangiaceae bacterium]
MTPLAIALMACGAPEHAAPADDAGASIDVDAARRAQVEPSATRDARATGTLVIATRGEAPSYLGSVHAVARNGAGEVVAGADEDENADVAGTARGELSLNVPAGESISIRLEAKSTEQEPSVCHAEIEDVLVQGAATAYLQVLSWRCGERTGYVPPRATSDCYWLVDWMSVARAAATAGEAIPVRVARATDLDSAPSVVWQAQPSAAGQFLKPEAAETSFVCASGSGSVSLSVTVTLADCVERLEQAIGCSP